MATIGQLTVNMIANTEKFTAGIRTAQDKLAGFAGKASLAAAGVTTALGAMLATFEDAGSKIFDMSKATGVSAEQLSMLKYAAEQSGGSLEIISKAFKELQDKGVDPAKFESIANAIAAIKDPTERAGLAIDWFGKRTGTALLPMLDDLPALKQRFNELGGGMTTRMAASADRLGDALGDLRLVLTNLGQVVAAEIAPAIASFTETVAANAGMIRGWIEQHGTLVRAIGLVAGAMAAMVPIATTLNAVCSPLILWTVVIAGNLYFLADSFQRASDGSLGFQKRIEALMEVVSPFLMAMRELYRYTGFGGGAPAPSGGKSAPKSSSGGGTVSANNSKVESNTNKMAVLQEKAVELLGKMAGEPKIQLKTAGIR